MSTDEIKHIALSVGFDACGISGIEPLDYDCKRLEHWVKRGCHADMEYMNRQRHNPKDLLPDARSAIVCLMNYYPSVHQKADEPQIAYYAYPTDYHYVIWAKLKQLANEMNLVEGQYLATCDTAPIMERAMAVRAGLGWIGRNTMLVNPEFGSFVFIGILFTTLNLVAGKQMQPRCGNCHKCIKACPTASLTDYCLDARRCLSYLTIESRETITAELAYNRRLFGCDICQMACPWNKRFAHPHNHSELAPATLGIDIPNSTNSMLKRAKSPLCRSSLAKLKTNYKLITEIDNGNKII